MVKYVPLLLQVHCYKGRKRPIKEVHTLFEYKIVEDLLVINQTEGLNVYDTHTHTRARASSRNRLSNCFANNLFMYYSHGVYFDISLIFFFLFIFFNFHAPDFNLQISVVERVFVQNEFMMTTIKLL